MKNSLSLICVALTDALNPADKEWGPNVLLIEENKPGPNGKVWWVPVKRSQQLLSDEDLETLVNRGFVTDEGVATTKRFGRKSCKAYGVLVTKLRAGATNVEQAASKLEIMSKRNKELENQLRAARESHGNALQMEALFSELRSAFNIKSPNKPLPFKRKAPRKGQANAGVPTLLCSDWHVGEKVDPTAVNFINEYNLDIFRQRSRRLFTSTLEVLFHHQSGTSYEGMVVSLAGDLLSGVIHEELRATNEKPILELLLELTHVLADAIIEFADNFPSVYVPCVAGNHGKIDPKGGSKKEAVDNFDYLLYRMVEMQVQARMGSTCNVNFDIAKSLDMYYEVYSTRYLLTHGDQVNTGTNSDDFWPAMMKMASRKQERASVSRLGRFDYMTVGHFHRYGTVSNVIVNGSLKGYCEWTYKQNYGFERPTQALWITHPEQGITAHIPMYGDEPTLDGSHLAPPITSSIGLRMRRG